VTRDSYRRDRLYSFGAKPFSMACGRWTIFRFPQFRPFGQRRAQACLLGCLAALLAGCSMSFPISPLLGSKEDSTGTIPKAPIANLLEPEDWRRAKAALSTALDPQGNGSLVGWDNPDSGNKGSFIPVGKAYPLNAGICRVFLAELNRKGDEQSLQGTACSEKGGDWMIAEAKPWKKDLKSALALR
jgi:surface antigen